MVCHVMGLGLVKATRRCPMLGSIARRHGKETGDSFVNATRGLSPTVACIEPGGCVVESVTGTCATVAAQIAIWCRNMIQCPPLSYTLNIKYCMSLPLTYYPSTLVPDTRKSSEARKARDRDTPATSDLVHRASRHAPHEQCSDMDARQSGGSEPGSTRGRHDRHSWRHGEASWHSSRHSSWSEAWRHGKAPWQGDWR